ncbi:tetratricopeptide repeat protein [Mesonia sp. JHPTF-M18]|uniref:Tetratricopeptide repeat protein n=1 Tax=Mesonia aestuariivivens TaxID=2796128 RepID=A0ABS6W568_9FLAO|nr:tetratricopeptide repeat protein [Mesonia aestuariivivens]
MAIKNYEEALQQNQKLVIVKNNLGKLYYQNRNY